jgi:putative DNA primase/helicase
MSDPRIETNVVKLITALLNQQQPDQDLELDGYEGICKTLRDTMLKCPSPEAAANMLKVVRRKNGNERLNDLLKRRLDPTMRAGKEYIPEKKKHEIEIPEMSRSELEKYLEQNQYGDALLFAHVFSGQVCYDVSRKLWYLWQGHYWKEDTCGYIKTIVSGHLGSIYLQGNVELNVLLAEKTHQLERIQAKSLAERTEEENRECERLQDQIKELKSAMATFTKRAKDLRKASYNKDVQYYAMSQERIAVEGGKWDASPYLLGVINGVIDLQSGLCRDGKPEDYIRSVAPTEWQGLGVACARYERFLQEIFELLPEDQMSAIYPIWEEMSAEEKKRATDEQRSLLIAFVHRLLGYSISGLSSEAIFPILFGEEGRNGKDTLFKRLRKVLGKDIASAISNDVILTAGKRAEGASSEHLCALHGKRLVWGSETKQGDVFNIAQVKHLTGDGDIPARPNYGRQYTFTPSHTLFLMTNNKPHAASEDAAFWTRAALIEFRMRFVEKPVADYERQADTTLDSQLDKEASGILAWLVRGYLEYQTQGLNRPQIVLSATEKYRQSEDILQVFIDDCCYLHYSNRVSGDDLYKAYKDWAQVNMIKPVSNVIFAREIGKRFRKARQNRGVIYQGISLTDDNPPQ